MQVTVPAETSAGIHVSNAACYNHQHNGNEDWGHRKAPLSLHPGQAEHLAACDSALFSYEELLLAYRTGEMNRAGGGYATERADYARSL